MVSKKAAIAFGLVYIPVNLYTAVQDTDIGFHLLHRQCGQRIRYKKACPTCGIDEVKPEDIVKGYEYEKNKYVLMDDEDFEKIKTEKDRSIQITQFVDVSEIDPIFYEKSYYVLPDGSDKAFTLLKTAMVQDNKIAIAQTVLGTKQNLVAIRPADNAVLLTTLHYAQEIRAIPQPVLQVSLQDAELNMAKTLIAQMSRPFEAQEYHDEYQERVRAAIEQKIQGREIVSPQEPRGNVIDLMEALKASVEKTKQQPNRLLGVV